MSDVAEQGTLEVQNAEHRMTLAKLLIRLSYWIIGLVAAAVAIVAFVIVIEVIRGGGGNAARLDKGIGLLNNLVAALFPMLAAWIGALIAYYFARENFEAATKSATEMFQGLRDERLRRIAVADVMIPEAKLTVARSPSEDSKSLNA